MTSRFLNGMNVKNVFRYFSRTDWNDNDAELERKTKKRDLKIVTENPERFAHVYIYHKLNR